MGKIALGSADVMFAFNVPANHRLAKADFAEYQKVLVEVDKGQSTTEPLGKDIGRVRVSKLAKALLDREGMTISWLCKKESRDSGTARIYILWSRRKLFEMSDRVIKAADALMSETWGWGRWQVIHNAERPDLIHVELVKPLDDTDPEHLFVLNHDRFIRVIDPNEAPRRPTGNKPRRQAQSK